MRAGLDMCEVRHIERRLPLHRVEIGHLHFVPGLREALHHEVFERAVERTGFGVGVDEEGFHG
jgi:hypothetical protein